MNFVIRQSSEECFKNGSFINELLTIDAESFPKKYQGNFNSIYKRYKKNNDVYLLAFNDKELIGYICFFPITSDLENSINETTNVYDDNILPDQITCYETNKQHSLFIISIAIKQKYRGLKITKLLMRSFEKFIANKHANLFLINNIYSVATNEKGKAILEKAHFNAVKTLADGSMLMKRTFKEN